MFSHFQSLLPSVCVCVCVYVTNGRRQSHWFKVCLVFVVRSHSPLGAEKIFDFLTVYLHIRYLHLTRQLRLLLLFLYKKRKKLTTSSSFLIILMATVAILSNSVSQSLGIIPFNSSSTSEPIIVYDLPDPAHVCICVCVCVCVCVHMRRNVNCNVVCFMLWLCAN